MLHCFSNYPESCNKCESLCGEWNWIRKSLMISVRRIQTGEGELFRQARLDALSEAPYAFSSTLASALKRSPESWQEQADRSARGRERATFLAFSDGLAVGIAALYQREGVPGAGELLQVWVAPVYRASAAAPLMDAVFAWAGENGYRSIVAEVKKDNYRALSFYSRCGFKRSDNNTGENQDEVVLTSPVPRPA
jgi:ribosomal protein S18 acetylase RimI-like enzyme